MSKLPAPNPGRAPPSPDSSSSSTDSSSYSDDTSSDSERSRSGDAPSSTSARQPPAQPAQSGATSQRGVAPPGTLHVTLNTRLVFSESDGAQIPLANDSASRGGMTLRGLVMDFTRYPEGTYRFLDYFRTAVEMFVLQVRKEYQEQHRNSEKNGREYVRFTWSNKGELAICFAGVCDMLKLLHNCLRSGQQKPSWETILGQLPAFLMSESRVPSRILTDKTYTTKIGDWKKGGTRYNGESTNVRFPSADERRAKVEAYLRSGAGYSIASTVIDGHVPTTQETSRHVSVATATPVVSVPSGSDAVAVSRNLAKSTPFPINSLSARQDPSRSASAVPPFASLPVGQGPVKLPMKMNVKLPGGSGAVSSGGGPMPPSRVGSKLGMEESRYLEWMMKLSHIKGPESQLLLSDNKYHMVLSLVRLCETADLPSHFTVATSLVRNSSERIQSMFDLRGGLIVLRRYVNDLLRMKDVAALKMLLTDISNFSHTNWSTSTRQAWLRSMDGKSTGTDLAWLRSAVETVGGEKKIVDEIEPLIGKVETIVVTPPPNSDASNGGGADGNGSGVGEKRPRPSEEAGGASGKQGIEARKAREPTVLSTVCCVRPPPDLRAPPHSSLAEQEILSLISRKKAYAMAEQATWAEVVRQKLKENNISGMEVPLWYDVYALLGVNSATLPVDNAATV